MGRTHPFLPSFNAGEFSPRMVARVDFDQYDNAAARLHNVLLLPQGGFQRRPGFRYVAAVKDSASPTLLLRFQFSTEQAYILEAGYQNIRFYRNQAQLVAATVGCAITNGTFVAGIAGWTDASAGTGAISHDATLQRMNLVGAGAGNEAIAEQVVVTGAPGTSHVLQFSTYGVFGDAVTVRVGSSSGASDYLADTGRVVGHHTLTFTPAASPFYLQFEYARNRTLQLDNVAILDGTPVEVGTPYDPVTNVGLLEELKYAQSADVMYVAHPLYPLHKLSRFAATTWSFTPVILRDGPYFNENTSATTLTLSGTSGTVTVTASSASGINGVQGFLPTDVNRLIRWEDPAGDWAWMRISGYNSSTSVSADLLGEAPSAGTATTVWRLGLYGDALGYPATVGFFEERLFLAGSTFDPQRIVASVTADFERFSPSDRDGAVVDDNALSYRISSEQVNAIKWLAATSGLLIGTVGGEFLAAASGAAFTPTDFAVRQQTSYGVADILPVKADNRVLFLQRAGRKLRDLRYNFDQDSYIATDVTLLSDHITGSGVVQMAYQREPDSLVWCVREDGQLAVLVYEPGQQVTGWSRVQVGGTFGGGAAVVESVATIPGQDAVGQVFSSADRDEVWIIAKRTINGTTRQYVEVMERAFEGPRREDYATEAAWETAVLAAQDDAFYVDSGLTYDGAATDTLSGLTHLEGETVTVWIDGAAHPDVVVSGGGITLEWEGSTIQVGLPYTWQFQSLKLAVGASMRDSTAVGKMKHVARALYVLADATAFKHGTNKERLEVIELREVADSVDLKVPLFTGEIERAIMHGNSTDPRLFLEGVGPGPFMCLGIGVEMATNDVF